MGSETKIKDLDRDDLAGLVQLKLPNLYRDFGQNFSATEANYIAERVAYLCLSDSIIRVCSVSVIGKAFDSLLLGRNKETSTLFKISPKMITSEISAIAVALDADRRSNIILNQPKCKEIEKGNVSTPTSRAVLWKMDKLCDGYVLSTKVPDKQTGEVKTVELISVEEVARCFSEGLNPDHVFRQILDTCPKNPKNFKGKMYQRF